MRFGDLVNCALFLFFQRLRTQGLTKILFVKISRCVLKNTFALNENPFTLHCFLNFETIDFVSMGNFLFFF